MFTVQWRIHPDLQISGGGGDLPRIRHSTKCAGSVVDHVVFSLCICRSVDDHIRVVDQSRYLSASKKQQWNDEQSGGEIKE